MTSRDQADECFVYIVLPGETDFVTAGRFALESRQGIPLGRFVYGRSYLARRNAAPIDPLELTLTNETFTTTVLKGVFGAIRDASPDHWGRRVIEKHAHRTPLGEIDYLLQSPDDRAGALGFGLNREPPAPRHAFNRVLALTHLLKLADAIVADDDLPEEPDAAQVQDLLLQGTSIGGARPKTVVEDHNGLWIAKFNRPDDPWNHARVEHAMLVLARECGVHAAESKVETIGGRDVLFVKRFDRELAESGYRRARMLSALTLLRAEDTHHDRDKWSYVLLVEELRRLSSRPRTDAPELFRRMCFNALISNTDDHPRNHAVIAFEDEWKLSPAYDLMPTTPVSVERRDLALACGDMGHYAHAKNLLSQSARFLLDKEEAETIIDEMERVVRERWYEIARREGVTDHDCDKISRAFAYSGFRLPL